MKKTCFSTFLLCFVLCSCRWSEPSYFTALDMAINLQDYYNLSHSAKQDSLRLLYLSAENDSSRWNAAYGLEKILLYHDIESCHQSVLNMLRLSSDDRQRTISRSCYANILYKMDSVKTALEVLRGIDTLGMSNEALEIYSFAG